MTDTELQSLLREAYERGRAEAKAESPAPACSWALPDPPPDIRRALAEAHRRIMEMTDREQKRQYEEVEHQAYRLLASGVAPEDLVLLRQNDEPQRMTTREEVSVGPRPTLTDEQHAVIREWMRAYERDHPPQPASNPA